MYVFYLHCFIQIRITILANDCIIHKFSKVFSQLMQQLLTTNTQIIIRFALGFSPAFAENPSAVSINQTLSVRINPLEI